MLRADFKISNQFYSLTVGVVILKIRFVCTSRLKEIRRNNETEKRKKKRKKGKWMDGWMDGLEEVVIPNQNCTNSRQSIGVYL
jgi:hypothetical protein